MRRSAFVGNLPSRSQFSFLNRSHSKNLNVKLPTPAILVTRQMGGIGDILMLTPTIRAIKELNPDLPLIVCTTEQYGHGVLFDILKCNPYVDKAITTDKLLDYSFSKVYNFGTGQETGIEANPEHPTGNRIDIFAELAGVELKDKSTVYVVSDSDKSAASKWIEENIPKGRRRLIGVQIRASTVRRSWPTEKVLLFGFIVTNSWNDTSVLLFYEGIVSERLSSYPNLYQISRMPIRGVAALMSRCEVFVAPDSGLLHLAGALGIKIIGLFGPNPPQSRLTYYQNSSSIYLNYPCGPCWYDLCKEQFRCMRDITVDMVLDKISWVLGRENPKFAGENILVIRMGGIGDLIMLTPSLRALKKFYPKKHITLATKPEHVVVLSGLPYIDEVITIKEANEERYDSVIDLRYRVESPEVGGSLDTGLYKAVNRIDMFGKLIGVEVEDRQVDVNLDKSLIPEIRKLLSYNRRFRWLGIQATCTSNLRTMPPEFIPELVEKFAKFKNLKVVLFGNSEFWYGRSSKVDLKTLKHRKVVNLIDKITDVSDLVALCSLMDYIIAPDTAAVHIAGALKKPCIAVFGNMPPFLRTKYYSTVTTLYPEGELECIPCYDFTNPCEYYKSLPTHEQPVGGKCMYLLTPSRIFSVAEKKFGLGERKIERRAKYEK